MKRFFCTLCKRVRRVRVMPDDVVPTAADVVSDRRGTCRHHARGDASRAQVNHRGRVVARLGSTRKMSSSSAKSKSK
jgi:hypothetical protein